MKKTYIAVAITAICLMAFKFDGGKIPVVTIKNIDGSKVSTATFTNNGKPIIISFWATWCIPCKKELTNIADLYEEWQKKYNVQIVAVSIDDSRSAGKVKPYIESQKWTYQVLLDVNQDLKRAFDIQSVPFTVIVDATGKVVSNHSGYIEGDEFVLEEELQKLVKK